MTKNEEVVYNWIAEGINKKNLDHLSKYFAPDYTWFGPAGERVTGLDETRQLVKGYFDAFPDMECAVAELFSSGDRIVLRWTAEGTHHGEFMGIKPTHRRIQLEGMSIIRMAGNKIVEERELVDLYGTFKQMSAFPEVREAVHA